MAQFLLLSIFVIINFVNLVIIYYTDCHLVNLSHSKQYMKVIENVTDTYDINELITLPGFEDAILCSHDKDLILYLIFILTPFLIIFLYFILKNKTPKILVTILIILIIFNICIFTFILTQDPEHYILGNNFVFTINRLEANKAFYNIVNADTVQIGKEVLQNNMTNLLAKYPKNSIIIKKAEFIIQNIDYYDKLYNVFKQTPPDHFLKQAITCDGRHLYDIQTYSVMQWKNYTTWLNYLYLHR